MIKMAMIRCPECNARVSDLADFCPHCGTPLDEGESRPSRRPPQSSRTGGASGKAGLSHENVPATPRVAARRDWSGRMGCLLVLLLLSGVVAGAFFLQDFTLGDYAPTESDAYDFALINIKNKLKSRSVARFPDWSEADPRRYGQTFSFQANYLVKTEVGEKVTKPFSATVRYVGSGGNNFDEWEVVSLGY